MFLYRAQETMILSRWLFVKECLLLSRGASNVMELSPLVLLCLSSRYSTDCQLVPYIVLAKPVLLGESSVPSCSELNVDFAQHS